MGTGRSVKRPDGVAGGVGRREDCVRKGAEGCESYANMVKRDVE